jgi:hypothetical protein
LLGEKVHGELKANNILQLQHHFGKQL